MIKTISLNSSVSFLFISPTDAQACPASALQNYEFKSSGQKGQDSEKEDAPATMNADQSDFNIIRNSTMTAMNCPVAERDV